MDVVHTFVAMFIIACVPSGAIGVLFQSNLPFISQYTFRLLFWREVRKIVRVLCICGIVFLNIWMGQFASRVATVDMACYLAVFVADSAAFTL